MHHEWQSSDYGLHEGPEVIRKDGSTVIDCNACGFKHVVPLPSKAELMRFYKEEFYQVGKPDYLSLNKEDQAWRAIEYKDRFQAISGFLPDDLPRSVLDIGCGPGDFLEVGRKLGWDCLGVEPSPDAAAFTQSRGVEVVNAMFDKQLAATLDKVSFIHMSEVLEHIPDPKDLLELACDLLLPGGVLCLSVPNDFNPMQRAFCSETGAEKWWVVPSHHLNYFDFESLEGLLQRVGLTVKGRSTNFPMELFLLMGQDYTTDGVLGRNLHNKRKNLDEMLAKHEPEARVNLYKSLAGVGLGRLAIVFAQKS